MNTRNVFITLLHVLIIRYFRESSNSFFVILIENEPCPAVFQLSWARPSRISVHREVLPLIRCRAVRNAALKRSSLGGGKEGGDEGVHEQYIEEQPDEADTIRQDRRIGRTSRAPDGRRPGMA